MKVITSAAALQTVLYSISCMFSYILFFVQDELKSRRLEAAECLQFVYDFPNTVLFQDKHFAKNLKSRIERLSIAAS